jgi:hypothetical protein
MVFILALVKMKQTNKELTMADEKGELEILFSTHYDNIQVSANKMLDALLKNNSITSTDKANAIVQISSVVVNSAKDMSYKDIMLEKEKEHLQAQIDLINKQKEKITEDIEIDITKLGLLQEESAKKLKQIDKDIALTEKQTEKITEDIEIDIIKLGLLQEESAEKLKLTKQQIAESKTNEQLKKDDTASAIKLRNNQRLIACKLQKLKELQRLDNNKIKSMDNLSSFFGHIGMGGVVINKTLLTTYFATHKELTGVDTDLSNNEDYFSKMTV